MSDLPTEFSRLRVSAGVSVDGVAEKSGYGRSTIYRWERGEQSPRPAVMELLRTMAREKGSNTQYPPAFRFIDLFAGIGGLRRSFEPLGGQCVFTSEWDKYSQLTYRANYVCDHDIAGDITKVPLDDIPEHDLLLAGFPCQPFSISN